MATEITKPLLLNETGQDIVSQLTLLNSNQAQIVEMLQSVVDAIGDISISSGDSGSVVRCESVVLDQSSLSGDEGGSAVLTAMISPSDTTQTLRWTSSNPLVASVSDGLVTFLSGGTAVIKATCGSCSASCTVTVAAVCKAVSISGGNTVTTTLQLTATVTPEDCEQPVTWESSDTDVVTVADGLVTFVSVGNATITVTCGSCSDSITVSAIEVPYTKMLLIATSVKSDGTLEFNRSSTNRATFVAPYLTHMDAGDKLTITNGDTSVYSVGMVLYGIDLSSINSTYFTTDVNNNVIGTDALTAATGYLTATSAAVTKILDPGWKSTTTVELEATEEGYAVINIRHADNSAIDTSEFTTIPDIIKVVKS